MRIFRFFRPENSHENSAKGLGWGGWVIITSPLSAARPLGTQQLFKLGTRRERESKRYNRQQQLINYASQVKELKRVRDWRKHLVWKTTTQVEQFIQRHVERAMVSTRYRRPVRPGAVGGMRQRRYRYGLRMARQARYARRIRPAQRGYVRAVGFYGRGDGNRPEMKFHDLDITDAVVAANGVIQAEVLKIPQGNGEQNRIGRRIIIKKISWRYAVALPATSTAVNTGDSLRVMMILDQQCNGALPAVTDILEANDWQSFNNLANSKRFVILMDKTYSLNSPSGSGRGTTDTLQFGFIRQTFQWHKSCNIKIEYNNAFTDGQIATIRSNNIVILLVSPDGVIGFESKLRFRFND